MENQPFTTTLVKKLADAEHVAVLTGAGMSAESGVPTFRDPGGLWEKFKPEELANVRAFLDRPSLVQSWYAHRRKVIMNTHPNAGHLALVDLEKMISDFTLITQNVDNLHHRAGSLNIVELHGNVTHNFCIQCGKTASEEEMMLIETGEPARCSACNGLIRPDVVWFGEMLPEDALEKAYASAERADVFLSIGTSAIVYPAAGIPLRAHDYGAYVAEINVQPSAIARQVDEVVIGKSGEVLPKVIASIRALRS